VSFLLEVWLLLLLLTVAFEREPANDLLLEAEYFGILYEEVGWEEEVVIGVIDDLLSAILAER